MTCERRHVLITGTSSGIGAATMTAGLAEGWHVFAGTRGAPGETESGDGVRTDVHLDVTSESDIATAMGVIADHVGERGLDGLANIAGIGIPGPLEIMPMAELRQSFEVDFFGQVALTQQTIPLLRPARGRIVFIGSLVDRLTLPFFGALATSKSAVASLADTWRQELAPWGIHVALVEPGFISTGADEATKARIDRLIADMTPAQSALYGAMFTTLTERGFTAQTTGSSPDGVAEVILDALTSKRPRDHYLTGSKAHIGALVAKLPQPWQDRMKRKAFDQPAPGSL